MRRSACRSLAATARVKLAGEVAARGTVGAMAPAAGAGHLRVGVALARPTKLMPKAEVTSQMRFPTVEVLLPAQRRAMGCTVSAVTIREPESPPALNDLPLIST